MLRLVETRHAEVSIKSSRNHASSDLPCSMFVASRGGSRSLSRCLLWTLRCCYYVLSDLPTCRGEAFYF